MAAPSEEAVRAAAAAQAGRTRVGGIAMRDGNVQVALEVDGKRAREAETDRRAVEKAVLALPGVTSATVVLTAEAEAPRPAAPQRRSGPGRIDLPDVGSIVAVASGKGGVGKSTVAVNLAVALARQGLRVGLMDSDVFGPSLPRMMGMSGRPSSPDGRTLVPMERWGVRCMSIGFLVEEATAMIWRGPMVMSAVQQLVGDVDWGELDILFVDMPPGTGDAQLTLAQRAPLTGAVIVSTPQDIALIDARKAITMFDKVAVPVLGLVENMSLFVCPHCGGESHVFGHGGARAEAELRGLPFLGEVPLALEIRERSDVGEPVAGLDDPAGGVFHRIAGEVWNRVRAQLAGARPAPVIRME